MQEPSKKSIFLPSLAIGGYRSFGDIQYFEEFSKINLFIGRNNCGKSNVLRVISELVNKEKKEYQNIDYHNLNEDNKPIVSGVEVIFNTVFEKNFYDDLKGDFVILLKTISLQKSVDVENKSLLRILWNKCKFVNFKEEDSIYNEVVKEYPGALKSILDKVGDGASLKIKEAFFKYVRDEFDKSDKDISKFIKNHMKLCSLISPGDPVPNNLSNGILNFFLENQRDAGDCLPREVFDKICKIPLNGLECNDDAKKIVEVINNSYGDIVVPSECKLISSTRKVSRFGEFYNKVAINGDGVVNTLNKIKNPRVENFLDLEKFESIENFLQDVLGNKNTKIHIPHDLETIHVKMNGRLLPLESLGSGIEEIVIIATAATLHENQIICIEEPELHLNPLLQKKLIRYLSEKTNNQYFIATHSAALLDTPDAEIYHLELKDGQTIVQRATLSDKNREICADLGYHPSDFLQSNCVIWVEGPTDRLYINWWLQKWWEKENKPELIEGIHYSIMFYGGRLLSHLEGDNSDSIEDCISLFRVNQRSVVVMDSDKKAVNADINPTKKRIIDEFKNKGDNGFVWVTYGCEIENYLSENHVHSAIRLKYGSKTIQSLPTGIYKNLLSKVFLSTMKNGNSKHNDASKIDIAKYVTENKENNEPDFSILDLEEKIKELYEFIEKSQPDTSLKS